MYSPSVFERKMSAPLFMFCAFPLRVRPSLANRSISTAGVIVTRRSTSFGSDFSVQIEPMNATRSTPGSRAAFSQKSSAADIRRSRVAEWNDDVGRGIMTLGFC
jgi:hypothetical protein